MTLSANSRPGNGLGNWATIDPHGYDGIVLKVDDDSSDRTDWDDDPVTKVNTDSPPTDIGEKDLRPN